MIAECPHCLSRVVPSSTGRCPACGRNVHEHSEHAHLTGLILRGSDQLPAHCYLCDEATDRRVTLDCSRHVGPTTIFDSPLLVFFFALLTALFGWFVVFRKGKRQPSTAQIRLKLPQCRTCAAAGRPVPHHTDFAQHEFTFAVHPNFKRRLLELNPGPRSAA